jgi:hypothetical protein
MGATGRRTRGALQKDLLQMQGGVRSKRPRRVPGRAFTHVVLPGQVQVKCSEMGDPGAA